MLWHSIFPKAGESKINANLKKYGIGMRLDENPFYFFEMRGNDVESIIEAALESKMESMQVHSECPSSRIIEEADIAELFGVFPN